MSFEGSHIREGRRLSHTSSTWPTVSTLCDFHGIWSHLPWGCDPLTNCKRDNSYYWGKDRWLCDFLLCRNFWKFSFCRLDGNICICRGFCDTLFFSAFWSYVSEAIPRKSAPKLFPFITTMGQLGSIFGPLIAGFCMVEFSFQFGVFLSFAFCGTILFVSSVVVFIFTRTVQETHQKEDENKKEKKPEMTMIEGLSLLWKDSYVRGIFAISTIYHIISTITDYQVFLD